MYGIIICIGILIASLLGEKIINENRLDPNNYWGAVFWSIIGGVIGARIYHVIDYWEIYSQNYDLIWKVYYGGLGIYGAIFGGLLFLSIYTILKREKVSNWLDIVAIVTPLGQFIGRWGNFVNKELYGTPTSLPWGIYINSPVNNYVSGYFHPLFLYESISNLILFLILWISYKKNVVGFGRGWFLVVYLMGYAIIRYWLEFLRIEPWKIFGINVAQGISIVLIAICVLILIKKKIYEQEKALETKTD